MAGDALALEYSRPVLARTGLCWLALASAGQYRSVPAGTMESFIGRSVCFLLAWVDAGIYRAGPLG